MEKMVLKITLTYELTGESKNIIEQVARGEFDWVKGKLANDPVLTMSGLTSHTYTKGNRGGMLRFQSQREYKGISYSLATVKK